MSLIDKIKNKGFNFNINSSISITLVWKTWSLLAGLLNTLLISKYFSDEEQGYYYTFLSLLTFQILFDLSLSSILQQFASHEMAFLRWDNKLRVVSGDYVTKSRLASLYYILNKWFLIASLLMLLFLITGGSLFFFLNQELSNKNNIWLGPWILLCTVVSLQLFTTSIISFIEGCDRVKEIATVRLIQDFISTIIFWIALLNDFHLYSLVLLFLLKTIIQLIYILNYRLPFILNLIKNQKKHKINFITEIWPFQWKYLITSLSSLFGYSLIVPLVFQFQGATASGKLGMTMAFINILISISMIFFNIHNPVICSHVAKKQYSQLDDLFKKLCLQSLIVQFSISILGVFFLFLVNYNFPKFAERLSDTYSFLILIASALISLPNIAVSFYLRAHKREVTHVPNLVISLLLIFFLFVTSSKTGLFHISVIVFLSNFCMSIWVYLLFLKYKTVWH